MSAKQIDKMFVFRFFIGAILSIVVGVGCSNPVSNIREYNAKDFAAVQPSVVPIARSPYTLSPGDLLNIRFTYHSEQDSKGPILIRPDGTITLEALGSIQATGFTPDQLSKIIAEKSSSRLRDPEVVVTIAQYAQKKIFVGGQVRSPGITNFQEGLTPLQAVFDHGGFTDSAQMDNVVLIRDAGSENPKITRLNLDEVGSEQPILAANDVIYVPMSGIGRANLWVRQHLRDIIPSELLSLGALRSTFGR